MFSSAWELVSSCCLRREWALNGPLGAEFYDGSSALASPVARLLRVLPVLRSPSPPSPSLPVPVSFTLSAARDPLALFLYDPDSPPLVTALRFILCCAAAAGSIRPVAALSDNGEGGRGGGGDVSFSLPSEKNGEEPFFLCLCRDSVSPLGSLGSDGQGGAASGWGVRIGEEGAHLQHVGSGYSNTFESRTSGTAGVLGTRFPSLPRSSSFSTGEDAAVPHRLPSDYPAATRRHNGANSSRTFEEASSASALAREASQWHPTKPALKRLHATHFDSSVSSAFFLPPCPVCGGLRLSEGAWARLLFASADGGGLTSDDLEATLFSSPSLSRRLSTSKSINTQLSSSSSLSKSLRRSDTRRQIEQGTLLVLPVLKKAVEEAAVDVEACAATSLGSLPECFCVIGAFSSKLQTTSFQVKEVLVLPLPSLSLGVTRKASGLLGVTGDAFGVRNETVTTLENALATTLSYGMTSSPPRLNGISSQEREEGTRAIKGLQRAIHSMQRALDDLTEMMPHQFVNNEQGFVCKAGQISIGGIVAGVGYDAQKASDVVAAQILEDLLIRLGLAGKVFPEDEGEAGEGGRSQETTAHGKRNEHRGKAKKRGSRELQDELLESLRQVASRLERPPPSYTRPANSSIGPRLFPKISFAFTKSSEKTSGVAAKGLSSSAAPDGLSFNAASNGCAVCICVVHEETQTLLVSNVGDISAVFARPLVTTSSPSNPSKKQDLKDRLSQSSSFGAKTLPRGASSLYERSRPTASKELFDRSNTLKDGSAFSVHHKRTKQVEEGRGEAEGWGRERRGVGRGNSGSLRKTADTKRVDSLSSSSGITSLRGGKATRRVTMKDRRREFGMDVHKDFVKMNFSFEAVVLTREHTLREPKERKRLMNAGIIPLGHISDDSEGQSSKSGIPFHSSPAYGSPFFSSAAGEEAHFAVGFPYNMTHGELYPDDFPFLQNGNPSPAVDYRKNRDSRRAPKGREELSSQLPHHRLLLEDPPSLFLCPDTPCPPLRCTRLLGMTAAQVYGVYSTPDVASVNISKVSSPGFVLIASSAVWDLVHPQQAVDLVAEELQRQYVEQLQRVALRYRLIRRQKQLFLRLAKRHLKKLKMNFDEEKHAWMKTRKDRYVSLMTTHHNLRGLKRAERDSFELKPGISSSHEKEAQKPTTGEWWGKAVTWVDAPPSSSSSSPLMSRSRYGKNDGGLRKDSRHRSAEPTGGQEGREEEDDDMEGVDDGATWVRSNNSSFSRETDQENEEEKGQRTKLVLGVGDPGLEEDPTTRALNGKREEGRQSLETRDKTSASDEALQLTEVQARPANCKAATADRAAYSWSVEYSPEGLQGGGASEPASERLLESKARNDDKDADREASSSLSFCDEESQPAGPSAIRCPSPPLPGDRVYTKKLGFRIGKSLSTDSTPVGTPSAFSRLFGLRDNLDTHQDSAELLAANSYPIPHGSVSRSFSSSSKKENGLSSCQSDSFSHPGLKVPRKEAGYGGLHFSPESSGRFFKGLTSLLSRGVSGGGGDSTRRLSSFLNLGQEISERADTFDERTEKPFYRTKHQRDDPSSGAPAVTGGRKAVLDEATSNNTSFPLFEKAKGLSTYLTKLQFPNHTDGTHKEGNGEGGRRHRISSYSNGTDYQGPPRDNREKDEGAGQRRYYSDSRREARRGTMGCDNAMSWRTRMSLYPSRWIEGHAGRTEDQSLSDQEKDGLLLKMLSRANLSPKKKERDGVLERKPTNILPKSKGIRKDPEKRRVSIHETPHSRFFRFESSFSGAGDEQASFPPLRRAQTHISSLFCDSLFTSPPPYSEYQKRQRWSVGFDFQAASTLVLEQFMEEWQLHREGLSMPDVTVLVMPYKLNEKGGFRAAARQEAGWAGEEGGRRERRHDRGMMREKSRDARKVAGSMELSTD